MPTHIRRRPVRTSHIVTTAAALAFLLGGCGNSANQDQLETLTIDFATYNPLSLVVLEHGWLDEELAEQVTSVTWVQSHGSNNANENLRANNIDIGATAGSAALLNRAVGAPTHTFYIESQPEWAALVVNADSDLAGPEDLEGTTIAATLATDPFFFLARSLDEAGLSLDDVDVQALQHADGRQALVNGDVDAWAGLDPIMADAERGTGDNDGAELLYRNVDFNTYSVLSATEDLLENHPEVVQTVVNVYEQARQWAIANHEETAQILADRAEIDLDVAEQVIGERVNFDLDPIPGDDLRAALEPVGPFFVSNGDVDSQDQVDEALESLFWPEFAENGEATEADGDEGAVENATIEDGEDQ